MRLVLAAVVASSVFFAGCAASAARTGAVPPAVAEPAFVCDASKAQWIVGQMPDAASAEKARTDAGAKFGRILKPGQIVTMEFNAARLNLHVDADGLVERVVCG